MSGHKTPTDDRLEPSCVVRAPSAWTSSALDWLLGWLERQQTGGMDGGG
jgi:hypothetical protein